VMAKLDPGRTARVWDRAADGTIEWRHSNPWVTLVCHNLARPYVAHVVVNRSNSDRRRI
jgi:hypothetical protein